MRRALHLFVLFGLVIVSSGRNGTGLELQQRARSDKTDCIYQGRVCERYRFGRLIFIRRTENTPETSPNDLSEKLSLASSSTAAVGKPFNVHSSSDKVLPASSSTAVGLVFVVPVSLCFAIYSLLVLRGRRRSSSQRQASKEHKCLRSGATSQCSREMASENSDAKVLDSTSACHKISMDTVSQVDSPPVKVELAFPSMSCDYDQNVVDPTMVAPVVDCIGTPGREGAAQSEAQSPTKRNLFVDADHTVAAQSEVQSITKKNLLVDTDIRETSQSQLTEIPSPVRRRRPSASFESPSPVRRRVSDAFQLGSPVRSRASVQACAVVPNRSYRNAIAEEVARDATAEMFRQILCDSATAENIHTQGYDMTVSHDHSIVSIRQELPVASSSPNALERPKETTTVDSKPVGTDREFKKDSGRQQTLTRALDFTASKQMDSTQTTSLVCSPARRCSSSAVVVDASAFSPGAPGHEDPEAGSVGRLKDFFKLEVEPCQAHALLSTPRNRTECVRKNSLDCSPAYSFASSSVVADASAFSPGASGYQEPEAGSTRRLKDFFEKRFMSTGTPENSCGQSPTKKTIRASTLADAFAKRSSASNSEYGCQQKTSKTISAELLEQNAD